MINIFALVIFIAILITGLLWCIDKYTYFFRKRSNDREVAEIDINHQLDKKIIQKIISKSDWVEIGVSLFPILITVFIIRSFLYEPFRIPSGSMMPTLLIGDFIIVEKFSYNIKEPIFQKTLMKIGHPKRGDVVVFKYPKDPQVYYIKRTIGLPGDKIIYNQCTKELTIQPNCRFNTICNNTLSVRYSNVEQSDFVQRLTGSNSDKMFSSFLRLKKGENKENYMRLTERKEILDNLTYSILNVPIVQKQFNIMCYNQYDQTVTVWTIPPGHYFMMGDNRDNSADSRHWGFVPEDNLVGRAIAIWMNFEKQDDKWLSTVRLNRIGWIH